MVLAAVFVQDASACVVDVDVANWWVEKHGYVQKARLKGVVLEARPKAIVKVWVRTKFHYERSDGRAATLRSLDRLWINTERSVSGNGQVTAKARLCDEEKPCRLNDVEVYEVECFD